MSRPADATAPDDPRADALAALRALAEATREPPPVDIEPDEVLVRAEKVLAERERRLGDLHAALGRDPAALTGVDEATTLHVRIQEETASWMASLGQARHLVGQRVHAVARLRRLDRGM